MKTTKVISKFYFIKDYYLDEVRHYKGYKEIRHDEETYKKLFPTLPLPLAAPWEIASFFQISRTHFHDDALYPHVMETIQFIKKCIFYGLTIKEINVMLALHRGLVPCEVALKLGISTRGVIERYTSVYQNLNTKGYKQALKILWP